MKKKKIVLISSLTLIAALAIYSCKNTSGESTEETMTSGNTTIQVDYSIQPVVEDALAVFQGLYPKAHITQVNRNEADIVQALLNDSARIAILTRELTTDEAAHFKKLGIEQHTVAFAKDGLALIASKTLNDTLVNQEDIYELLRGEDASTVKQLVFDNSRSGIAQWLIKRAKSANKTPKNVYSVKNTAEVFNFVKANPGAVGVVGVNWILQPPVEMEALVKDVKVLGVSKKLKGTQPKDYFKPSQSVLAEGNYPLTRTLYVLNYEGKNGLGTGFANYITSEAGQRLILKSGLLPVQRPPREIEIVNK